MLSHPRFVTSVAQNLRVPGWSRLRLDPRQCTLKLALAQRRHVLELRLYYGETGKNVAARITTELPTIQDGPAELKPLVRLDVDLGADVVLGSLV